MRLVTDDFRVFAPVDINANVRNRLNAEIARFLAEFVDVDFGEFYPAFGEITGLFAQVGFERAARGASNGAKFNDGDGRAFDELVVLFVGR